VTSINDFFKAVVSKTSFQHEVLFGLSKCFIQNTFIVYSI